MAEDKIEEETYSLIFTSLKHPIRRRMLRMLAGKSLTFSEILESLSIDSGHLSYHLESLGDLVAHAQDGKYQLSSIGVAAVKLMGDVEEHPSVFSRRKFKPSQVVANVYPLILAVALLAASLYFITYTTPVSTTAAWGTANSMGATTAVVIGAGQTLEFNVTVTYMSVVNKPGKVQDTFAIGGVGTYAYTFQKSTPICTITVWERGSIWLDLGLNIAASTPTIAMGNVTSFSHLEDPNFLVTVYKPDGTMATDTFTEIGESFSIDHLSSPNAEITQPGTYRYEIKNNGSQDWRGTLTPNISWQLVEKPYFYYGVSGLLIALLYPVLISSRLLKNLRAHLRRKRVTMTDNLSPVASGSKRTRLYVGIVLIILVIVAAVPLGTYVAADNAVTDALNNLKIDIDRSQAYSPSSYAEYSNHFNITNVENVDLTLNITISGYVTNDTSQSVKYSIGSVVFENKSVKGHRSIGIWVDFNITSKDIVDMFRSRYIFWTLWSVKITASGSYLFWHITKQKMYELTRVNPRY